MRMWMVEPSILCRRHLLGEHVELHMFVGTMRRGCSLKGYVEKNLLDASQIESRHAALVREMTVRGYAHRSPLPQPLNRDSTPINLRASFRELLRRCPDCRTRYEAQRDRGKS